MRVEPLTFPVYVPVVPEKLDLDIDSPEIVPPEIVGFVMSTSDSLSMLFVPAIWL